MARDGVPMTAVRWQVFTVPSIVPLLLNEGIVDSVVAAYTASVADDFSHVPLCRTDRPGGSGVLSRQCVSYRIVSYRIVSWLFLMRLRRPQVRAGCV